MKFYTHVALIKNEMYVRGYNHGQRYQERIRYRPYLFVRNNNPKIQTDYKNLDEGSVEKIDFDSVWDARQFVKKYDEVDGFDMYGMTTFVYPFINDEFSGQVQYDENVITTLGIDIETKFENGFPDPWVADQEITAITLEKNGKEYVALGTKPYKPKDSDVTYIQCKDEIDLITKAYDVWRRIDPDMVTGWHIDGFDIPYLINRTRKLLGEEFANKLSPWGIIELREVRGVMGDRKIYDIIGLSVIDYIDLYKKFSFQNQESYKLDFIAQVVLGEKKIEFDGDLNTLYETDFEKFMDYNIHDARLVRKIDNKLGFLKQVMAIAYNAKINYLDAFTSVRLWDVIIHNHLLAKGIVIPTKNKNKKMRNIVGGYVKDPAPGMYKLVVSFDIQSSYPHQIMQYNISPETLVHQLPELSNPETCVDKILSGIMDTKQDLLKEHDLACTALGLLFTKKKQGFLPTLMRQMYDDRVSYRKKLLTSKEELSKIEAEIKRRLK